MNNIPDPHPFWSELYSLLKSSTLIQGCIALITTGAIIYLYVTERQVPDTLVSIVMLILGYYFGAKSTQQMYGRITHVTTDEQSGIDTGSDRQP